MAWYVSLKEKQHCFYSWSRNRAKDWAPTCSSNCKLLWIRAAAMSSNAASLHFKLSILLNSAVCMRYKNFQDKQFQWMSEGALVGQSAAEMDAAHVLSDTCYNRAHLLTFSLRCQTDFLSFCHHFAHSSFCLFRPCDGFPHVKIQVTAHSVAYTHSVSLTLSSTCSAHREWGRDVEVGLGSENIILALQIKA